MSISLRNMFSLTPSSLYEGAKSIISNKDKRIVVIAVAIFAVFSVLYSLSQHFYSRKNNDDGTTKITYWSGLIIEGTLKNGKLEGPGKKIHPNGAVEEGIFKNGKLDDPNGKITHANATEIGEFVSGKFVKGVITFTKEGEVVEVRTGSFTQGKLHGVGLVQQKAEDGELVCYQGEFERGLPKNINYIQYKDRALTLPDHNPKGAIILMGSGGWFPTMNLVLHGYGKIQFTDGSKTMEGNFDKGVFTQGTITWADKTVWEGSFKEEKLHGLGKITDKDGNIQEGGFIEGVLAPKK